MRAQLGNTCTRTLIARCARDSPDIPCASAIGRAHRRGAASARPLSDRIAPGSIGYARTSSLVGERVIQYVRATTIVLQLLASPANALGQDTTGMVTGTITDASGGVLAGADVTVESVDTAAIRTVQTDTDGRYVVLALPSGAYRVRVALAGFKPFMRDGITLQVGQHARVDARLDLGSMEESVTVSGAALLVDTRSSSVGTVVDHQRLEQLPMNGR